MTDPFTPRWWNQSSNRPGMYQRIRVFDVVDFTGGLNLTTDAFKLAPNESPEMLNVDVDRRGGFQIRRGVAPFSTSTLTADPDNLWVYSSSGVNQILAQVGNAVYYSTGGTWSTAGSAAGSTTDLCRASTFKDTNYWVRGNANSRKWNGSTIYDMGTTFNDNYLSPTGGNVPRAKVIASHAGYMWVANTYESGTQYKCRVRFSHYLHPEDWASTDYIEVETGKDGDEITALVPIGDHLLVCKRDSMYAIYGFDSNTFSVVNVSNTVGAVSQEAAVITQMGVAVFDHNLGLHLYNGKGTPQWMFQQIYPALRDGQIPAAFINKVQMGWLNGRLWISVPWDGVTATRGTTFVWSPLGAHGGSFTRYDLPCGPFVQSHVFNQYLCAILGYQRVFSVDQEEYFDDFGSGATLINGYYRTKWFDAGQASMKKRWKRLEAIMQAEEAYELPVLVHYDFNPQSDTRTFKLKASGATAVAAEAVFDTTNWGDDASTVAAGEGVWAQATSASHHGTVDRGSSLGLARAVSLTIGGPVPQSGTTSTPVFWGVDGLVFKFVPRRIR